MQDLASSYTHSPESQTLRRVTNSPPPFKLKDKINKLILLEMIFPHAGTSN